MRSLGKPAKLWVLARSTWTARLEYAQQRLGFAVPPQCPRLCGSHGQVPRFPCSAASSFVEGPSYVMPQVRALGEQRNTIET